MKLRRVILILLCLCFFIIPVSAVGDDNKYNAVWFADNLTYSEKVAWFKELVDFSFYGQVNTLISRLNTYGDDYYTDLVQKVISGTQDFNTLTIAEKLAVSNYILYGSSKPTQEQLDYKNLIDSTYATYIVSEDKIKQDIDNNAIPTLNPIPDKLHYDIPVPQVVPPTPQER